VPHGDSINSVFIREQGYWKSGVAWLTGHSTVRPPALARENGKVRLAERDSKYVSQDRPLDSRHGHRKAAGRDCPSRMKDDWSAHSTAGTGAGPALNSPTGGQ
jgi:hypothetical protein